MITNTGQKRQSLTVGGLQSTLWVLSTDYNNYELVYQCGKVVGSDGKLKPRGRLLCLSQQNLNLLFNF